MSRLKIQAMALEPSLWGTLPKELLHLVFARLPIAGIGQLRILSKEWKRNVDCKDSEFNEVLEATTHLNTFALLSWRSLDVMSDLCDIYDVQADKWHVRKIDAVIGKVEFMDGADGGLVCFVLQRPWHSNNPGVFIVMNLLTKQKMQLPPLLCMGAEKSDTMVTMVRMVKLIMDRKTKEYKVFVVGSIDNYTSQAFFAQVYDSHIKEWMVVEATQGRIIGWDYFHSKCDFAAFPTLCVYDCVDGTLQHFNGMDIAPGLEVEQGRCVLIEDHLFVLHKEASPSPANLLEDGASMLPKYCISEFHLPKKATAWEILGVHSCVPCKCLVSDTPYGIIKSRLWGCNGVLLVYSNGSERAWLYNLSTCEWRSLPAFRKPLFLSRMCTISWSAIA